MRVGISHDFFARGLNDYANWKWAWVRELAQNGVDCGARNIHFLIYSDRPDHTVAVCWNDGPPMDKETLLDKFLCLGGTTKTFSGTTGGFGIAKTVIALAHESYKIETGPYCVEGKGGEFELTEQECFSGTKTTITMEGDYVDDLIREACRWVNLAQCPCTFHINGDVVEANMHKGSLRRQLEYGRVYSNRQGSNELVVRINGMPMFTDYISLDRLVIVELGGSSAEVMTSNRDGLVYPYSSELHNFVTELAVDKKSALKKRNPRYIQYQGPKLCHRNQLNVAEVVGQAGEEENDVSVVSDGAAAKLAVGRSSERGSRAGGLGSSDGRAVAIGANFVLKNETDMKIPSYYDPGSGEFSSYSRKLVRIWGRLMLEMHRLFNAEASFSVGFIFDDMAEAQCEQKTYGLVYYINPCVIVEQSSSFSRAFRKRFKLTERERLIMISLHEFVHFYADMRWHDENYANKLTEMAATVLKHRRRFNWCFR